MSVLTPNMNLTQPTIGVDSGYTWEQAANANSGILDGHTHAPGSGVQIQPSGLNISSDLPFNSNNAIALRSTRYTVQTSPLSLGTDLACVYFAGVDLYANDANGNQIQITKGGVVNATSSGISSGNASASFSGGVLVVDSNTNTPGNIQAGSYLMGQVGVAGSNFLTLQPPSGLSSGSYSLTFPTLPSSPGLMLLSTSGNMSVGPTPPAFNSFITMNTTGVVSTSPSTTPDVTATGTNIVTMTSTGVISTQPTFSYAVSNSSGTAQTTSGTFADIFSINPTIITLGGPVQVSFQPATITSPGYFDVQTSNTGVNQVGYQLRVLNGSNVVYETVVYTQPPNTSVGGYFPGRRDAPGMFTFIDTSVIGAAGSYQYIAQFAILTYAGATITATAQNIIMIVYEIA